MMLWDGSRHDWLEGPGPMLCLIGAIDDASEDLLSGAHFVEHECTAGYLPVLKAIAGEKGRPWSAYMDQHGSLKGNDAHWTLAEEWRASQDPTQVGRALQQLEIEVIYALSPQAKGRVERLWGTLQDRLVSELRLAGASTAAHANAVLTAHRPDHHRHFALSPTDATPAWRPLGRGTVAEEGCMIATLVEDRPLRLWRRDTSTRSWAPHLDRVCSFHYEATVLNDNTVRLSSVIVYVPPGPRKRSYAGTRVELRQLLDRNGRVYLGDRVIATAAGISSGELRALRRHRKRPPTAASAGKPSVVLRTPSVSPAPVIASGRQRARDGQNP